MGTETDKKTKSLLEKCYANNIISRTKASNLKNNTQGFYSKEKTLDIVKKSMNRSTKYLIIVPFRFIGKSKEDIKGHLRGLDTNCPSLYLSFPNGRVKLNGVLAHTNTKIITFRHRSGQFQLEDQFEQAVVFPEYHWIGTAEENPSETPLEWPENVQVEIKKKDNIVPDQEEEDSEVVSEVESVNESDDSLPKAKSSFAKRIIDSTESSPRRKKSSPSNNSTALTDSNTSSLKTLRSNTPQRKRIIINLTDDEEDEENEKENRKRRLSRIIAESDDEFIDTD